MGKSKKNGHGQNPSTLPPGAVKREAFTEKLPVKVEDAKVREAATLMAHGIREQEALDEERREAMAGFKERQAAIKDRQKALAETVEKGTDLQDVACAEYLLPTNEVVSVRLDTGEIFERRTADKDDLQEKLEPANDDEGDEAGAEG